MRYLTAYELITLIRDQITELHSIAFEDDDGIPIYQIEKHATRIIKYIEEFKQSPEEEV